MLGSKPKDGAGFTTSTVAISSGFAVTVRLTRYPSRQRVLAILLWSIHHQPEQARRYCTTTMWRYVNSYREHLQGRRLHAKRPCMLVISHRRCGERKDPSPTIPLWESRQDENDDVET